MRVPSQLTQKTNLIEITSGGYGVMRVISDPLQGKNLVHGREDSVNFGATPFANLRQFRKRAVVHLKVQYTEENKGQAWPHMTSSSNSFVLTIITGRSPSSSLSCVVSDLGLGREVGGLIGA